MQMPHAPEAPPSRRRLALVVLVFPVLAVLSAVQTLAIVGENGQPDKAAAIAPWDGSAQAHFAKAAYQSQLAQNPATTEPPVDWIADLALEAYQRQPLVPGALAVIGAERTGNGNAAFWDAAAKVSRRDTLLQGMLLNFHLQADNLDRTIRVLNQILQVRIEQRPAAYAAMTQALRDPRSVATFVDILETGPDWLDGFLITASRDDNALGNLGLIRQQLPDEVVDPTTDRGLVRAFANAGELDLAHDLYARHPDDAGGWNSGIPPFDWTLANQPGFRAQVMGGEDELQLTIARGKGGVFASRILPAHSRTFSIRGQHDLRPQQQVDRLEIAVRCVGDNAPVARTNLAGGKIVLNADLPADCGFVEISLSGRAWSDGQRVTGSIAPLIINAGE
ncbi:hypothetical protein [Pelagerythrobacter rhizovicinus]|uniref:Uncharacterized protein n=1 Tax=Pelagerythrobacter rhizovicinus TaxID=2268576 RepID=A0A4Q2KHV9_9SPHN|nr:hypothetical protein [Pelagerythrobacter rhizovicinus]RXZ64744.1 hypothetical protein ETX26_12810 [Pelagerythrobacter rhizovicinus]